jgi:hypothetical protein
VVGSTFSIGAGNLVVGSTFSIGAGDLVVGSTFVVYYLDLVVCDGTPWIGFECPRMISHTVVEVEKRFPGFL